MKRTVTASVASSPKRARNSSVNACSLSSRFTIVDDLQLVLEAQVAGQMVAAVHDVARRLGHRLVMRPVHLDDPDLLGQHARPHVRFLKEGSHGRV